MSEKMGKLCACLDRIEKMREALEDGYALLNDPCEMSALDEIQRVQDRIVEEIGGIAFLQWKRRPKIAAGISYLKRKLNRFGGVVKRDLREANKLYTMEEIQGGFTPGQR